MPRKISTLNGCMLNTDTIKSFISSIKCTNGIINIINQVLIPQNICEPATEISYYDIDKVQIGGNDKWTLKQHIEYISTHSLGFGLFIKALEYTGLMNKYLNKQHEDKLTIFMPSDSAFKGLFITKKITINKGLTGIKDLKQLSDLNLEKIPAKELESILLTHFVMGCKRRLVPTKSDIQTIQGCVLDKKVVNDSIIDPNIIGSNGVIHTVGIIFMPNVQCKPLKRSIKEHIIPIKKMKT